VARNRVTCTGHDLDGTEDYLTTRVGLDIEGNQRTVRDANQQLGDPRGRIVMHYAYDMLGNRIRQVSMEAGARWMLQDVTGNLIRAWDARGHNFATTYDALHRPTEQTVRGTTPDSDSRTLKHEIVVERVEYGERHLSAEALNLRTRVYRQLDSAGIVTNAALNPATGQTEAYDFKGNLLRSTRRLLSDYTALPDWLLNPQLDAEIFEVSTRYDALNRPIQTIAPHSNFSRAQRNVIQPVYDRANLLKQLDVWRERANEPAGLIDSNNEAPSAVGIANVDYDAKGQRQRIDYKNGVCTTFGYDPLTFRLIHVYTRRGAVFMEDCDNAHAPPPTIPSPDHPPGGNYCGLQNLRRTYDPAGNLTHIHDDAQQTIYFRNQRIEPSNEYTYDACYRLIQASGREHLGQLANGARNFPTAPDAFNEFHTKLDHPDNHKAMGTYIERYLYDADGNFLRMQHRGSDPAHAGWTRTYGYAEASLIEDGNRAKPRKISNRLTHTTLSSSAANSVVEPYLHDAHGNLVRMPHLGGGAPKPNMHWDYRDQLRGTDLGGGGKAFYVYDAAGQRARKVWEKAPGLSEERIYLGGLEIFRKHAGAPDPKMVTLERETLHVMDSEQRVALVETRTLDTAGNDSTPPRLIRYQFGSHPRSASLELDERAHIISYEEYAPYGSSTYQAVRSQTEVPKRYRYTGKERDEETGLCYYGARYYAPWLGRWISCDPAGLVDGANLYCMSSNDPINLRDLSGMASKGTEKSNIWPQIDQVKPSGSLKEVQFSIIDPATGQPITAQIDYGFPSKNEFMSEPMFVEAKGDPFSPRTANQKIYHPLIDKGVWAEIRSDSAELLGLKKGDQIFLKTGHNFMILDQSNLASFKEGVASVYASSPTLARQTNGKWEFQTFSSNQALQEYLAARGSESAQQALAQKAKTAPTSPSVDTKAALSSVTETPQPQTAASNATYTSRSGSQSISTSESWTPATSTSTTEPFIRVSGAEPQAGATSRLASKMRVIGSNAMGATKFTLGLGGTAVCIVTNSSLDDVATDLVSPHFGGVATHNQAAAWEKELFYGLVSLSYKLGLGAQDPGPYKDFHLK
jgi:RHS repeat-associated protein